jgi:hypothetical protein
MRTVGLAAALWLLAALTSGCQTQEMVQRAEHERLYGTPHNVSSNWNMTNDSNDWRPWER